METKKLDNVSQFVGLKQHSVMQFPLIRVKRRESLEETLNELSSEQETVSNISNFPRTSHLYKSDLPTLERIVSEAKKSGRFKSTEIVHSASDLGLTHKIRAIHNTESIIEFDGLWIRVTKEVFSGEFELTDLLSKTGYPKFEWNGMECNQRFY